VSSCCRP